MIPDFSWLEKVEDIPAVYIHIPFCHSICPFCNFSVIQNRSDLLDSYLEALLRELKLFKKTLSGLKYPVKSVYFGGGTPSIFGTSRLNTLKSEVESIFPHNGDTHWSIELNPEDCTQQLADGLSASGFNRISLGVQSFSDNHLKVLERNHSAQQSHQALDNIREAGITNINLDLMFGYPELSIDDLHRDLQQFLHYSPKHLSAYSLNIEPGSQWFKQEQKKNWLNASEALIKEQYEFIQQELDDAGIHQYEISNYALDGYESRQNILNWTGRNYLGMGLSAHSMIADRRWSNPVRWFDYSSRLKALKFPAREIEALTGNQIRDEFLMTRLRMNQGISLVEFKSLFNIDLSDFIQENLKVLIDHQFIKLKENQLFCTQKGLLIADEVTLKIVSSLDYKQIMNS